jgi:hypothetical protein
MKKICHQSHWIYKGKKEKKKQGIVEEIIEEKFLELKKNHVFGLTQNPVEWMKKLYFKGNHCQNSKQR